MKIFISYEYISRYDIPQKIGSGNTELNINDAKIGSIEDIQILEENIKKHYGYANVVIMNWRRFE